VRASLSFAAGVLWVARRARSWRVEPHDLDGRRLAGGFGVRAEPGRRARVSGLAVDRDRRVWLADPGAGRVRCCSAFGAELPGLARGELDAPGSIGEPIDVACDGVEDGALLAVAQAGERNHALQLVRPDGAPVATLDSRGERRRAWRGLTRCGLSLSACAGAESGGALAWACERASGLVQVFRGGRFDHAWRAPRGLQPEAAVRLEDGRWVLLAGDAHECAVLLVDAAGRELATLARPGRGEAQLDAAEHLAVEPGAESDRRTRVAVLDRAGARIQVFNLEGECYGGFEPGRVGELP
jgi:hypothetical protein